MLIKRKKKNVILIVMEDVLINIKKIRKSKGYSQAYLAQQLNITESTYSKIERGETELTVSRLNQISKILDTSVINLLKYPSKEVKNKLSNIDDPEVILQIKLSQEKKDQVLSLIFGENKLEIFNK